MQNEVNPAEFVGGSKIAETMSLFFMKGEREKEKAPQNFFAVSGPQFIGRLHLLSPEFQNRIQNSIFHDSYVLFV